MTSHLILAGGGHAHLTVLRNLNAFISRGHRVTVVGPSPFHYYSGMGPGMLAGIYLPEAVRFNIREMTEFQGGAFCPGRVEGIDPVRKRVTVSNGGEIPYDVLSVNLGSRIPFRFPDHLLLTRVFPVKPIENLMTARRKILRRFQKGDALQICVAGGGAAGVEIAGNLMRLADDQGGKAKITLIAGKRLLSGFSPRVRKLVSENFGKRGIRILEGRRLKSVGEDFIELSDQTRLNSDFIFPAVGTVPPPLFPASGLPVGSDGGMLVNGFLQSVRYPEIFGGGDCISFQPKPLKRVGVYAVRQNPVLFHNLRAALTQQGGMKCFRPQKSFLLVLNLGDGNGVFIRNSLVWMGKTAFRVKDVIDRKFMKDFQEPAVMSAD